MKAAFKLGRFVLALLLIISGTFMLLHTDSHKAQFKIAEKNVLKGHLPAFVTFSDIIYKVDAALFVFSGLLMGAGVKLSGLLAILAFIPYMVVFDNPLVYTDPMMKQMGFIYLLKDISIIGGCILVAVGPRTPHSAAAPVQVRNEKPAVKKEEVPKKRKALIGV